MFGSEAVVGSAEQPQIIRIRNAAFASRMSMVELQPSWAAAAHTVSIDPAATEPIAFEHRPAGGAENVGTLLGRWPCGWHLDDCSSEMVEV